jgi:hypothetical protein
MAKAIKMEFMDFRHLRLQAFIVISRYSHKIMIIVKACMYSLKIRKNSKT